MQKYQEEQERYLLKYIQKNEQDIFETYAGRTWISNVSCMSMKILRKYKDKEWNWFCLSKNKAISKDDKIASMQEFPWHFQVIVETMDDYVRCCKLGIDIHFLHSANLFDFVVYNKNICKDVDSNPNFMWNWNFICLNNSINEAFLLKHKEKWFHDKFFYQYISLNPSISLKFLFSCQVPLSYIATNPNVNEKNFHIYFSKEIVNNSEEIQNALTENECISIDFILTHPEYKWNLELIQFRNDITEKDILKHKDYFNFERMENASSCQSIDKNFLKTYNLTNYDSFYRWHNGLTIKEVMNYPMMSICLNTLCGTPEEKIEFIRKVYAVKKIEKVFLKCYWSPEYAWGRKRLEKEYDSLYNNN